MGLTQILKYSLTLPFDQMPQFFTYVDTQNIYTQLPPAFFFFFVSHSSVNITTDKDTQYDHRHNQLFLIKNHACSYGYVTTSVSGRDFWRFRSRLFRIRGRTNWHSTITDTINSFSSRIMRVHMGTSLPAFSVATSGVSGRVCSGFGDE
ncbi:hypothetical protein DCAR_0311198 [Daucus carota subsp. sativus]|uniref:Uncharacterized protein n=1 Tax=Daucus carota subsp. sativus TaxID=79200 RepID=A0AAF0WP98_DAUCS|nr:hypothetical protein DCAR_0311198 [Daucus carota subsp. sativus]